MMKKLIGFALLSFIVLATLLGPAMVKAMNPAENDAPFDLAALQPEESDLGLPRLDSIHPSWKRLGIIPGCDH